MKKTIALFLTLIYLITVSAAGPALAADQLNIVASFYPIYILAMNVFDGIEAVSLSCMTAPDTGCLHDYQLLASDMMTLSRADVLLICGAGMESYLPGVTAQFPSLQIIDCSEGIDLIPSDDEDEGEFNAHTWLDVQNAVSIVRTIAEAACGICPEEADAIRANADKYTARLITLDTEMKESLAPVAGKAIVTFHEAFPYFARAYGLEIVAVINEEHEDTIAPSALAAVINAVREAGNPPLFTEPQYSAQAAITVSMETGAKIYELDPLVTGDMQKDAYEIGMLRNAEALLHAFEETGDTP